MNLEIRRYDLDLESMTEDEYGRYILYTDHEKVSLALDVELKALEEISWDEDEPPKGKAHEAIARVNELLTDSKGVKNG